jgi:hypothetical protein
MTVDLAEWNQRFQELRTLSNKQVVTVEVAVRIPQLPDSA